MLHVDGDLALPHVLLARSTYFLTLMKSGTVVRKKAKKRKRNQEVDLMTCGEEGMDETQVNLLSAEASSDADTMMELQALKSSNDPSLGDNAKAISSKRCYSDSVPSLSASTHDPNTLPPVITYSCVAAAVLAIVTMLWLMG